MQSFFRGESYYIAILPGGNPTIQPFFRGEILLYSHFSEGENWLWGENGSITLLQQFPPLAIFPGGKLTMGEKWLYNTGICKFVVTISLYGYNLCNVNIYFRFGRKPTLFMCLLLLLVAGCVASAAPNFYVFIPFYILQGAAQTGLFLVTFTLGKSKEAIL